MQVQRIAARGSLPTRAVHIPGAIVDKVAVLTTCACFQPHVDVFIMRFKSYVYVEHLTAAHPSCTTWESVLRVHVCCKACVHPRLALVMMFYSFSYLPAPVAIAFTFTHA